MANDIFFGTGELDDLKLGTSQVDKVYLGSTLVWPISVSGEIITVGVDFVGQAGGDQSGSYSSVPQDFSDGSGTGATFDITVVYVSNKNRSVLSTATVNSSNLGSGYIVGEVITLDMSSVSGTWNAPDLEVLTVT